MDTKEEYRIDRLNSYIELSERKRTIALITIYSAIAHCNTLTPKQKEKAESIVYTLRTAKNKKKYNVKKQLENRLKKQLESNRYISSNEVEKTVESQAQKYRINLEWQETHSLASKISKNPAQAALDAANEYISCSNRIEQYKEEIANPPKKETKKETKKQTDPKPTQRRPFIEPIYEEPIYTEPTSYEPRVTESKPKEIIPQPYTYSDSERVKYEKTITYLTDKYKKEASNVSYLPTVYFQEKDRKMLQELFGGDKYQNYVIISEIEELIENSYSVEAILNKFNIYKRTHLIPFKEPRVPTLENLLDMALIIYNDLPKELTTLRTASSERSIFLERLTNQVGVIDYLDKYNEAYNIFMKYYNKLSDEEKTTIKNEFNKRTHPKYEKLGIKEFDILHPNELKRLVNNKVTELMKENYYVYGNKDVIDVHARLKKSTKFMTIEQIVSTYHQLQQEKDKYISYSTMTEEDIKYRREWFDHLQHNFAHLLIQRLTEEQTKDKTTDQQLYLVCKEYLKEEPRFPLDLKRTKEQEQQAIDELYGSKKTIENVTGATVSDDTEHVVEIGITKEEDIEASTSTAVRAGYNAMNRFYGLKKVEQTIERITGRWAKFERAWQKAQKAKSETEIQELTEEFNGMFRR